MADPEKTSGIAQMRNVSKLRRFHGDGEPVGEIYS